MAGDDDRHGQRQGQQSYRYVPSYQLNGGVITERDNWSKSVKSSDCSTMNQS